MSSAIYDEGRIEPPSLRELFGVALPMVASQASETIMLFVDRLFLSRLGSLHLAASMSGGLSSFVFVSLFAGIVGYTNALVAQYYGAKRRERCVATTVQGLWLALFFLPGVIAMIPIGRLVFVLAGHSAEQIDLGFTYYRILMFGGIFVLIRQAFVGFFLGIGRTRIVMIANVSGMVINIPLNYVLIFGAFGMPRLEIVGAAIATIVGSTLIAVVLGVAFVRHRYFREATTKERTAIDRDLLSRLIRFGLPAGLELFLNVFAFNVFVQLAHSLGPGVAAAVTIVFNYDMLAFIPMVGLSVAVTSLVGRQMGAGSPDGARKATFLALRVGYVYAICMMSLFLFAPRFLVSVFAGGLSPSETELFELAVVMLRLASLYTIADITQLVFGGALRGAGDTRMVAVISVVIHYVMAAAAVLFVRVLQLEPLQIWGFFVGFAVALGGAIYLRFATGRWRSIRVIEEQPLPDLPPAPVECLEPEINTESRWI